jgi:threonine aldolase
VSRNFKSDNVAPVCDAIMAAINAANIGTAGSYGADEYTDALQHVAGERFAAPVSIFPVATGTAANALALSQLVPPFGAVVCHEAAHIATDECGAPEFFTGGAKLLGFPAPDGKIAPQQVADAVAIAADLGVHHVKPCAVSLTQATEWGTVYSLAELAAIAATAKQRGLRIHMDGARFANALVHLGCTAAEATWKSGIDVLSLGATKNGALCAEAVVFFDPELAQDFERRRKRAGHLWSKLRFVSAQWLAYFEGGLWLDNARHANDMATALAEGLQGAHGARLLQSVDANEVFIALPETTVAALETAGYGFYRWPGCATSPEVAIRLVTSYATSPAAVRDLVAAAERCG